MSGNAGGGRAAGGGAGATTASATTKMLQNIKEIVGGNFPEDEIRAMLKECNMDPGETIHRLLNEDTFHEVKSKREKKKETKDNGESRSRGVNNSLIRGARGGADFSGRMGSTQVISSEYAGTRSKPMQRRDNGPNIVPISSVVGSGPGESTSRSSAPQSNSVVMENTGLHLPATADTFSSQYSAAIGNAWTGVPGQRTLADIVKMGRPPSMTTRIQFTQTESCTVHNISTSKELHAGADSSTSMVLPSESHREDFISNVLETVHEPVPSVSQEKSHDEWPSVTQIGHSLSESDGASAVFIDQSTSSNLFVAVDLGHNCGPDKRHAMQESLDDDNLTEDSGRHVEASDRRAQVNTPVEESCNDVSVAMMSSLQQQNLHEDTFMTQADDNPAVIFPNNLQITNSECSHLSFGSFRSGMNASFSESFAPNIPSCNLEVPSETTDDTAIEHSDARDPEYYSSEQLRPVQNENVDPTPSANSEDYEIPSSHPDDIRIDSSDATEQAYTRSSPSNLLRSAVQPAQEFDRPYSSLLAAQLTTTEYTPSVSSINVPSIAMLEGLKPGVFSTAQPTQHNLPTTVPMGPTVPQPLSVQSYPQPTLPLGHFANLIGYPFLPQSYAYMPSAAFQQPYTSNGAYNQAPAAVGAGIKYTLPQFKTNVAVPHASVVSSGLGGFGSSTNILGNFSLNPSTSSANTTVGYDGMSSSQYKDENHFVRAQQSESPTIWLNEGGSRTMSSLAARTYYGLQRQNQVSSGIRQSQQLSPYGAVGYQNLYQSQAGVSQEHQQYSVGGLSARVPASQMASQMWQHNY